MKKWRKKINFITSKKPIIPEVITGNDPIHENNPPILPIDPVPLDQTVSIPQYIRANPAQVNVCH